MREYSEFKELIDKCGNRIFTTVLEVTGSRELTIETMSACADEYMECKGKMNTLAQRYKCFVMLCSKRLNKKFFITKRREKMTNEEKGIVLKSAELYYKTGGRARKRRINLIIALITLAFLGILFAIELHFMYSDGLQRGWREWEDAEDERESNYPSLYSVQENVLVELDDLY